jgi:soluble cytochrome b562
MTINWDELSPEEVLTTAKNLERDAEKAAKGVEALEKKRDELIVETKRQKKAMRMLSERGLDPRAQDFEDKFSDFIAELDEFKDSKGGAGASGKSGEADSGAGGEAGGQGMNPEVKAMLERMNKQIESLTKQNEDALKEKESMKQEMQFNHLKNTVLDAYREAGVKGKKAEHLFLLTKDRYSIAEDGKTIYSGDEYEMVPLSAVVENLRGSDEYGDYFVGSGNTGSGFQGKSDQSAPAGGANPFRKGGNATEAAVLFQENPQKARLLFNQAVASGTVDPVMRDVFQGK